MLLSNVHLGHTSRFLNTKIKPFLLGYRNNIHILNISFTSFQFKLLLNLIINLTSLRQKILLVNDKSFFNFRSLLRLKNIFYVDKKWIGGSLTNFRRVRKSQKFKEFNNFYNGLGALRYMPSLVFFFDINMSKWPLIECSNLGIPVSAIVDSNTQFFNFINYPIVGNNQSFEAIYLYLNILRNAVIKGRQKELLRILKIV